MKSLAFRSLVAVFILIAVMAALIFVPAGTLDYWQAWVLLTVFGATSLAVTLYLYRTDPALLERRMRGGPTAETRTSQKIIMWLASAGFVALLAVSGLDHRFHGSALSPGVEIAADVVFVAGFAIVVMVFHENSFTAATIEVSQGQTVISTGPYGVVRHPMYAGALLYLLAMPIALGSWWGFVGVGLIAAVLIWRIFDEEQLLTETLPGYGDYKTRTRYRLVPLVW